MDVPCVKEQFLLLLKYIGIMKTHFRIGNAVVRVMINVLYIFLNKSVLLSKVPKVFHTETAPFL